MERNNISYKFALHEHGIEFAEQYLAYENKTEDNEKKFLENLNETVLSKLFELIDSRIGRKLSYSFNKNIEKLSCSIESNDFAKEVSILNAAWTSFRVTGSGHIARGYYGKPNAKQKHYGGYEPCDIDFTKDVKLTFCIIIQYFYKHNNGGSNGAELFVASYDGEKWTANWEKKYD